MRFLRRYLVSHGEAPSFIIAADESLIKLPEFEVAFCHDGKNASIWPVRNPNSSVVAITIGNSARQRKWEPGKL